MYGKGMFLWNVPEVAKGDPAKIADLAVALGLERVDIKVADGYVKFGDWAETLAVIRALKDRGIGVFGWMFAYNVVKDGELAVSVDAIRTLHLDGYVVDWEGRADSALTRGADALALTKGIKRAFPTVPLGWCSWALFRAPKARNPWHPTQPTVQAMLHADFGMPMAYNVPLTGESVAPASGAANALWMLDNALAQWRELTPKPLVPAGRAYTGDGTHATPEAIMAFGKRVRELGLPGESWWSMEHCAPHADWLAALTVLPKWSAPKPKPEQPPVNLAEIRQHIKDLYANVAALEAAVDRIGGPG